MKIIFISALHFFILFAVLAQQVYRKDYSQGYKSEEQYSDDSSNEESGSSYDTQDKFSIYRFNPYLRDWDKDGLINEYDRDDDNDGILDRVDLDQYKNNSYYQPYAQGFSDSSFFRHYTGDEQNQSSDEYYEQGPVVDNITESSYGRR